MIRERIRSLLLRALDPLRDRVTGEASPGGWSAPPPARDRVPLRPSTDPGRIRVQPGTGDLPGPNHPADTSTTWVAAQVVSGVPPFSLDCRPEADFRRAHLPGAIPAPDATLEAIRPRLPSQDTFVVVYDATGEEASAGVAAALRDAGWIRARRLAGGFLAWSHAGEPIEGAGTP